MPKYFYDHVHLISPDPIQAAEFYEKGFEAKRLNLTTHADGATMIVLSLTGTKIIIRSPRNDETRTPLDSPQKYFGLEHFGIMTDDIDTTARNLKALGVQFVQEVTRFPELSIAYVIAPDNVLVEIMERKGKNK